MLSLHKRYPWIVSFASALLFLAVALVGTLIGNQVERLAGLPVNSGIAPTNLLQLVPLIVLTAMIGFAGEALYPFG